ncbi:hypothetical protein GO497_07305 [Acidovorax citrulli]|nr:hypothetical protein [Paracidovorax citrulli]
MNQASGIFGIEAASRYLPQQLPIQAWAQANHADAATLATLEKQGMRNFHHAGDESVEDMAGNALQALIDSHGLDREDVDLLVFVHSLSTSTPAAPASLPARLASAFGLGRARCFALSGQNCASLLLSLRVMRSLFHAEPDLKKVLLVSADRCCGESYRTAGGITFHSDGASALPARPGHAIQPRARLGRPRERAAPSGICPAGGPAARVPDALRHDSPPAPHPHGTVRGIGIGGLPLPGCRKPGPEHFQAAGHQPRATRRLGIFRQCFRLRTCPMQRFSHRPRGFVAQWSDQSGRGQPAFLHVGRQRLPGRHGAGPMPRPGFRPFFISPRHHVSADASGLSEASAIQHRKPRHGHLCPNSAARHIAPAIELAPATNAYVEELCNDSARFHPESQPSPHTDRTVGLL